MPFASIDGVRLHYAMHGESGDPVVFVHGYTGAASDWREQVAAFTEDHRLLVFDNRGHGSSEAPPDQSAYTVEAMVEDTLRLIEQLGLARHHLVGHSIGGAVAQEIALRRAPSLLSLTLADTSDWFGDHAEPGGTRPYVAPEDRKRAAGRVAAMSRVAVDEGWKGLLAWQGSRERARAIRLPTLIVHGSRDASRIVEGSQRLAARMPQSQLVVIEGAGHSPHRERPAQFNAVLRRFFGEVHAASAGT